MTCVFVTSNFIGRWVVSPALYAYSWKPDLFRQLIHTMYKVLQKKVVLAEDEMKMEKKWLSKVQKSESSTRTQNTKLKKVRKNIVFQEI